MFRKLKIIAAAGILSIFSPCKSEAVVVQDATVVLKNGMWETGYQERKQQRKVQRNKNENPASITFPEPDYSSPVKNDKLEGPTRPVIAVSSEDDAPAIDYNDAIAKHLFGTPDADEDEGAYVVRFSGTAENAIVEQGRQIEIKLNAPEGVLWHYEKSSPLLKYLDQKQEDGVLTLFYQAEKTGTEKFYFDSMEYKDGSVNVLESKILNVKVK